MDSPDLRNPITYYDDSDDFDARQLFAQCCDVDSNKDSHSEQEELGSKTSESSENEELGSKTNKSSGQEDLGSKTSKSLEREKLVPKTSESTNCIACTEGNFPTGAHTCIKCNKNVHILPGCSFSIGSEEGYGTKRICISCRSEEQKSTQTQDAREMNSEDQWKPKKSKVKQSVYLQSF